MTKITEDYINFEVAKLLKEKGFVIPLPKDWIFCMYDENGNTQWGCYHSDWYPRITLQMAMKWLREVHNIVIVVTSSMFWGKYNVSIYKKGNDYPYGFDGATLSPSYEYACESAIKYCLKNLI